MTPEPSRVRFRHDHPEKDLDPLGPAQLDPGSWQCSSTRTGTGEEASPPGKVLIDRGRLDGMKSKLLNDSGQKTWALVFDEGEEPAAGLLQFARENQLSATQFTAIGAFSEVELGFFQMDKKDYKSIPIREQVEVLSLIGDITLSQDGPKVHAHVVLGKSDGTACGGHLLKARVRPTLEVILTESPRHLQRTRDEKTGLALIDPGLR